MSQDQYEGTSVESFVKWCEEIMWPVILRDLADLGQSAHLRIQGNIYRR